MLIRHHHCTSAGGGRGDDGERAEHPCDRHVAVQVSPLGAGEDLGVELALDPEHGQAGGGGRTLDRLEASARTLHDEQGGIVGLVCELSDGHRGVEPATEGDQEPA